MSRLPRGHTIPELMIASFLLAVVLTVSGRLAWLASRSKSSSEAQNGTFRQASIALERMQREVSHSRDIYAPTALSVPFEPRVSTPLVLCTRSSRSTSTAAVIAYYRDPNSEELFRFTYKPDFDPALPLTQVVQDPPKVVATGVVSFQVYQVDPMLRSMSRNLSLNLVISNRQAKRALALPLATEVRLAQ